jgi:integrase
MKPISANKYLTWIRALLNRAYDWGALDYRPKIPLNRVRWARNRFLSDEEERRVLRHCPERIRTLIEFYLDTGARKDEALRLTWGEVDLTRKPRPVVYFIDTKNGEARAVPLPKRSADNLRKMKDFQGGRSGKVFVYPAVRTIYRNDGSGIIAREGELAPIASFQKSWEIARSKAGVPDCRLHDLRHTYASRLVRKGVPILHVARLLGHRTIGMTMRYSHLTPVDLDQAVSLLDET